jgi:hypothetical protein
LVRFGELMMTYAAAATTMIMTAIAIVALVLGLSSKVLFSRLGRHDPF